MRSLTPIITISCFFFFQAEDGIRDRTVTGVQTCALPISDPCRPCVKDPTTGQVSCQPLCPDPCRPCVKTTSGGVICQPLCPDPCRPCVNGQIGRASCRESV